MSTNSIKYLDADCWLIPKFLDNLMEDICTGCRMPPCNARNFKAESKVGFSLFPPL